LIQNAIREIDIRGSLSLQLPFFGYSHLIDELSRLTSIISSNQQLRHLYPPGIDGRTRWCLEFQVATSLELSDTYHPVVPHWVLPDNMTIEYEYDILISDHHPHSPTAVTASKKLPDWLMAIRGQNNVDSACIPQVIRSLAGRIHRLELAGLSDVHEVTKLYQAMLLEGLAIPPVLELNLLNRPAAGLISILAEIVGTHLTELYLYAPKLSFDSLFLIERWTSFTRLRHIAIMVTLSPHDTNPLTVFRLAIIDPPLYLQSFTLWLQPHRSASNERYAANLGNLLPAASDLARAMYKIGGPTCEYSIGLVPLDQLHLEHRDIPHYLRHAKLKRTAMNTVTAFHYMSMYDTMVKKEIRKLEGAERVKKGWAKIGKVAHPGSVADVRDGGRPDGVKISSKLSETAAVEQMDINRGQMPEHRASSVAGEDVMPFVARADDDDLEAAYRQTTEYDGVASSQCTGAPVESDHAN
jgi:hypothetical protein